MGKTKPKDKGKITIKRHRDGYYHFYLNGEDITNEWMWFFSGLSTDEEKGCVELFLRRRGE